MELPLGSMHSQADVTMFIVKYAKSNSCFDPITRRRIFPNAILTSLLRLRDTDMLTIDNLQSFLKVHYIKP